MNDFKESSTLNRMQERYWTTKQAVFRKLGKKDDDCIVASDSELDTKLELFQTIEESFLTLMRVLENYQDKLCGLAQEENAMGRFLKENGKFDKTKAGKVMTATGKTLSFNAQQKLSLRLPLVRLYHEVETFQYRAIVDTLQTVEKMEKSRTAYRGALMWMKDVSQQLDPDTCKQLERFRKVQSNVRKTKARFDKLKLDTLQKVDLLSFSRCNLFSQALAAYQNTLIEISRKMSNSMTSVAETTKGYQHYEFSFLKELSETSKKLADEATDSNDTCSKNNLPDNVSSADKDVLLFFESEFHDEDETNTSDKNGGKSSTSIPLSKEKPNIIPTEENIADDLIAIGNCKDSRTVNTILSSNPNNGVHAQDAALKDLSDLLTGIQENEASKSDLELLKKILDTGHDFSFSDAKEPCPPVDDAKNLDKINSGRNIFSTFQNNPQPSCYLPSQLLDMNKSSQSNVSQLERALQSSKTNPILSTAQSKLASATESKSIVKGEKGKQDMASWYNLFADLDPLANPDLVGKKPDDEIDC